MHLKEITSQIICLYYLYSFVEEEEEKERESDLRERNVIL